MKHLAPLVAAAIFLYYRPIYRARFQSGAPTPYTPSTEVFVRGRRWMEDPDFFSKKP